MARGFSPAAPTSQLRSFQGMACFSVLCKLVNRMSLWSISLLGVITGSLTDLSQIRSPKALAFQCFMPAVTEALRSVLGI